MIIYIFADLEGISGISGDAYVNGEFAAAGRQLMVEEINLCASACFEAGADRVIVRDGHGSGVNFSSSQLDSRIELVQGATPGKRFFGLEGASGLILLGYHAMAGTPGAILEHTYSSKTIMNLYLNGRPVGEIGLDAAIAGEYGVPVILVSGDDKACREAEEWIPGVRTCCVKEGFGCNSGLLYRRDYTVKLLRETTLSAVRSVAEFKPLKTDYPATVRWDLCERCPVPVQAGYEVLSGRSYQHTAETVEKAFLG